MKKENKSHLVQEICIDDIKLSIEGVDHIFTPEQANTIGMIFYALLEGAKFNVLPPFEVFLRNDFDPAQYFENEVQ